MQMHQIRLIFLENDFIEQKLFDVLRKTSAFCKQQHEAFGKYHIRVGAVFSSYWTAIIDVSQGDFFQSMKSCFEGANKPLMIQG